MSKDLNLLIERQFEASFLGHCTWNHRLLLANGTYVTLSLIVEGIGRAGALARPLHSVVWLSHLWSILGTNGCIVWHFSRFLCIVGPCSPVWAMLHVVRYVFQHSPMYKAHKKWGSIRGQSPLHFQGALTIFNSLIVGRNEDTFPTGTDFVRGNIQYWK